MSWRIWLLIITLLIAILTIINFKGLAGGIVVKEIQINSSAAQAGITVNELIKEFDGKPIRTVHDYYEALSMFSERIKAIDWNIEAEEGSFSYKSKAIDFELSNTTIVSVRGKGAEAGLRVGMKIEEINDLELDDYDFAEIKAKLEPKEKLSIRTEKQEYIFLSSQDPGLVVAELPKTRLRMGLDLQGGARAIVQPERALTVQEMNNLLDVVRTRLSVYGLTDVTVKEVSDLEGKRYMLIEMAGATPEELHELVGKQGKFEAKIANQTVFIGGRDDIPSVCIDDPTCAFIESCSSFENQEVCRFRFSITLSASAAERHAKATAPLTENFREGKRWLNETLDLYLDDRLVEQLYIDAELKGKPATAISIEGSGIGTTREEAFEAARAEMRRLQTILITGSLPFKLEIVKLDSISPALGKEFARNILLAALAVFIAVCAMIYFRYRKPVLFIPVIITIVSEVLLVLFLMALFSAWWTLDLAAIAGILAAIGTGVDDQIVMIDEASFSKQYSLKERIKRAFTIIFFAYATTAIALVPLWWAGTGLLKGFAISTLLGITVGVLITRPAFAEILKKVSRE